MTQNVALEPIQPRAKRMKTSRKPVESLETTDGANQEGRASSRSKASTIMDVT